MAEPAPSPIRSPLDPSRALPAAVYGDAFADVYDDWYHDVTDTAGCARAVVALAGGQGSVVLELGIGTGRVALAAAALGADVRGIDASAAMLDRLAAKTANASAGATIAVHLGDMADVVVPLRPGETSAPPVDAVIVTYNTLFNLPDATTQRRCLAGAARVLRPGGVVIVEVFVPGPALLAGDGSSARVRSVSGPRVVLSFERHDWATQRITGRFVDLGPHGVALRPFQVCWQTPDQLDALAAEAGLELAGRFASWSDVVGDVPSEDALDEAATHIVVYRLPDRAGDDRGGAR